MKRLLVAVLLSLLIAPAFGQVKQSGTVTPRHLACWTTTGIIQDCGTAANGFPTSIGATGQGPTICANSAAITGPYNQLCFGANTSSNAQITLQNFGGAPTVGLDISINGTITPLPSPSDPLPVISGGTGAGTASGARTNLGLGTMAVQNATAVNITGGGITGLPSPTFSSDAATKGYVDAIASGLNIHNPVAYATAAVLPSSPSYGNGSSGVGATLTAGGNGALTVDGTAVSAADRVLVKNQASALQNGCYTVTTVGDGSNPYVLTRCTDFDTSAEMVAGSYFFVTGGATNINSSYVLQSTVATVGSTSVTFVLFSQGSQANLLYASGTVTSTGSATTYGTTNIGKMTLRSNSGTAMLDLLPGTSPGVLASKSLIAISNRDSTALLQVKANTGATLDASVSKFVILAPGEQATFVSDGSNYFTVSAPSRARLINNTNYTFYLDPAGSDSNSCITAAVPCLTLQAVWDYLNTRYDHGGSAIKLKLADGTYAGFSIRGRFLGQYGNPSLGKSITIEGNTSTPISTIIDGGAATAVEVVSGASINLVSVKLQSASGYCIYANLFGSFVGVYQVNFGTCALGGMLADGGEILISDAIVVSGNGPALFGATRHGWMYIGAILTTFDGARTFSAATAVATKGGLVEFSSSATFTGSAVTASRYIATLNAIIDTSSGGASFIPGNSVGTTSTGGQYN